MKHIKEKGYEHYLIDTEGNVYNSLSTKCVLLKEPKLLKSHPNKNGYITVVLRNGIKAKAFYVHRLVASIYLPNPLNLEEVNHKNFVKSDNFVSNLEWVSRQQNLQHMVLNKPKLMDILLDNKSLIQAGIEHYQLNKDVKYLSKLWNISSPYCLKILRLKNVKITRYKLGNSVMESIFNEILNNKKPNLNYMKDATFVEYIKTKYNVHFTQHILNKLKKNKK